MGDLSAIMLLGDVLLRHTPLWESLSSSILLADELIVVNFSSDELIERCLEKFYSIKGDRMSIFNASGVTREDAFHYALNLCCGKWVFVTYPDEIIHENSVHYINDIIARHGSSFDLIRVRIRTYFGSHMSREIEPAARVMKKSLAKFGKEEYSSQLGLGGLTIPDEEIRPHPPVMLMPGCLYKLHWFFPGDKRWTSFNFEYDETDNDSPLFVLPLFDQHLYSPPMRMPG